MKLESFSVEKFRSITSGYNLPIRQSTVLIGKNNEGKSNILRALVRSLEILTDFRTLRMMDGRIVHPYIMRGKYNWESDFPVSLQASEPKGESIFRLEFTLNPSETKAFHQEVKSTLNGTLPIELCIGPSAIRFRVLKKGPGAKILSQKKDLIARFLAKRINIKYIPAIRTAEAAHEIVTEMVERELAAVQDQPDFKDALAKIAAAQDPILKRISTQIAQTLKEFLPDVSNVKISISRDATHRALRRNCDIKVNDGTLTDLTAKGEGVQSLAALSLMRHISEARATGSNLILAIEEPESHLHPDAIHRLRTVLAEIAGKHQVIMTTHCPVFVDRLNSDANIIVHRNQASPAPDIASIRSVLGVRAADNLRSAEVVLIVEGEGDRRLFRAILAAESPEFERALNSGVLAVDSLLGGANLAYKLALIRDTICTAHCFMDDDATGRSAATKAQSEKLLNDRDITFSKCPGLKESEIEDLIDRGVYESMLKTDFGITLTPRFKSARKWSDRMGEVFQSQGKTWDDAVVTRVKNRVVDLALSNPKQVFNANLRGPIDALISELKAKLGDRLKTI